MAALDGGPMNSDISLQLRRLDERLAPFALMQATDPLGRATAGCSEWATHRLKTRGARV